MEQKELIGRFNRPVNVTMPKNEWDSFFATGVQHTMHNLAVFIIDTKYNKIKIPMHASTKVSLKEEYLDKEAITFKMPLHEYNEYEEYAISRYSTGITDAFAEWYVKKHGGSVYDC